MSDVCVSLMDMMRLKADSSVSVILLASPQSRKSEVTRMNGFRYCFSMGFMSASFSVV